MKDNKESIFEYIDKNIQRNGKLSDQFDLSIYRHLEPNDLRFADGMMDYCITPEEDKNIIPLLLDIIRGLDNSDENLVMSILKIDNYYESNPKKTILANIDNLLKIIIEDSKNEEQKFSISLIYRLALYMILFSKEIETVKIGIAIIGLFPLDGEDKIIELLEKLSLCEEFTKYTSIALNSLSNSNEIKFKLAKKLSSYGKIILVDDLEPNTEEIVEWLLCHGCENDADNGWIAINIAQKINLPKFLHEKKLSEDELVGLFNIVEALLEEGPQKGISIYEKKEELFSEILNQYGNFKTNLMYLQLIVLIKNYCEDEKFEFSLYSNLIEILNNEETKQFIINEIDKGIELSKYIFIARHINYFDIFEKVYAAFKNNVKKNMNCLGYIFENTKDLNELLDILRNNIDLKEVEGEPEPVVEFGGSIDLISIIQYLSNYPFIGEDFVIAGLKSKTMHPRNAALRTIIDWKKKSNMNFYELSDDLKNAIKNLKDKEVIKSYKEMINEILEIDEDLSSYTEPNVDYGYNNKKSSTGINIFNGDIDSLFDDTIKFRGIDYFDNDMIHQCEFTNYKYISYVQGSNFSTEYKVIISIDKNNEITDMECNCPYQNNCKHEYATLLYIRKKYKINENF